MIALHGSLSLKENPWYQGSTIIEMFILFNDRAVHFLASKILKFVVTLEQYPLFDEFLYSPSFLPDNVLLI